MRFILSESVRRPTCVRGVAINSIACISPLIIVAVFSVTAVGCDSDKSNKESNPIIPVAGGASYGQGDASTQSNIGNQSDAATQSNVGNPGDAATQLDGGNPGRAGNQDISNPGDASSTQANLDASTVIETQDSASVEIEAGEQDSSGPYLNEGGIDAGPTGDSAINVGPIDYGEPGPYEVLIEKNVGETFRNNVSDDTALCAAFIAAVGSGNEEVARELTTYPEDMDRGLYTLFRPATLDEGKKYPVITWGNGTCSHPLLFTELLDHLASHGFIVIASNWRWVSSGVEMLRGIDFILSENENANSPLYGKIDTEMLGACGHSQGSFATVVVGADNRIVTTVPIMGATAADVAALKGPTFLIAGELDTLVSAASVETAFNAATQPAVYGMILGYDHLMPGLDPKPILKEVTTWFKIHLSNDQQARELFYGDPCGLCTDPGWVVARKNI